MQHCFSQFHTGSPELFPEKLKLFLAQNLASIELILEKNDPFTWDNLLQPLEDVLS